MICELLVKKCVLKSSKVDGFVFVINHLVDDVLFCLQKGAFFVDIEVKDIENDSENNKM